METALYQLLTTNEAIADLVGKEVSPQESPPNAGPNRITYVRTDGANLGSLGGRGDMDRGTYDVRCFAATQTKAIEIGKAVEVACDVLNQTFGDVFVNAIDVMSVRDEEIQGKDATGSPTWARVVTINGFWRTN